MNFDAVVVGAGPGGAFSAYWLAKNGLKVLLLERRDFPGSSFAEVVFLQG
jgi:electron transfer flavoprotein-quinone oxidoreductase